MGGLIDGSPHQINPRFHWGGVRAWTCEAARTGERLQVHNGYFVFQIEGGETLVAGLTDKGPFEIGKFWLERHDSKLFLFKQSRWENVQKYKKKENHVVSYFCNNNIKTTNKTQHHKLNQLKRISYFCRIKWNFV